ncbi:MAG TPA: hypothetical protein VFG65_00485 [Fimbriimonadales bacterium]|nr:hypothetical protein [Fimbriimonadales bacterium]
MIFVSINPFALKRFFFFLLAAIGFSCLSCFGESLLLSVKTTPYDRQMSRIRLVLQDETRPVVRHVSLGIVNRWIRDLRSIPYGFTPEWKTPDETHSGQPADCKAKAVALYATMQAHGATHVRLIIGKRTPASRSTHAWLEWETENGSYLLDPTWNWKAYAIREVGRRSYIPYYAFEGSQKFRAATMTLVAQN